MEKKKNPLKTSLCDLLGIEYPIIQGAMGLVTDARLVAAVSNAGGLGVLASINVPLRKLKDEISQVKDLTDRPFAVNLVPMGATFHQRAEIIAGSGVKIVTTGRGDPRKPVVSFLKSVGVSILPVVPTVRHAKRMEEEGADVIIASGMEGGGHVGQISSLPLVSQVVTAVNIPVVAAGGFGDGRGLVAALALGACGIQMGTRFIATKESIAHPEFKQMLLDATEEHTVVTSRFTGKTLRVLKNRLAEYYHRLETESEKPEMPEGLTGRGSWTNAVDGNVENGILAAGQVAGLIKDVVSVESLVLRIMREARETCAGLAIDEAQEISH